jgi:hypothetical protein
LILYIVTYYLMKFHKDFQDFRVIIACSTTLKICRLYKIKKLPISILRHIFGNSNHMPLVQLFNIDSFTIKTSLQHSILGISAFIQQIIASGQLVGATSFLTHDSKGSFRTSLN